MARAELLSRLRELRERLDAVIAWIESGGEPTEIGDDYPALEDLPDGPLVEEVLVQQPAVVARAFVERALARYEGAGSAPLQEVVRSLQGLCDVQEVWRALAELATEGRVLVQKRPATPDNDLCPTVDHGWRWTRAVVVGVKRSL